MPRNNMTFRIGGQAGQGVESGGAGFAKAFSRGGLHVFGLPDYMSRVRGGHNFYTVRVAEEPVLGLGPDTHLLLALDAETIDRHRHEIVSGGGIIYNEGTEVDEEALRERGVRAMPMPLVRIAGEVGNEIMANTGALAAAAGVVGYDLERINSVIRDNFRSKGQKVVDANLEVARRSYAHAQERYAAGFEHTVSPIEGAPQRMLVTGNQAFCMGALMGGCRFVAAYPMTPATTIIEWMSGHAIEYGVVTKHVEDEIAAICMAIGANHAGVRGMAATSGGGFSLMVEAFGLAGMTETPLVIYEAQRPGPATGMPTRTEQADLLFMLHASQGEFLRLVVAPGTIEDMFDAGWRSFNLAEKYQTPVVVLCDELLANASRTIERSQLGFEGVAIDRGNLLTSEELDALEGRFKRYAFTETGISPRAIPGHPKGVFQACSDEHDEYGTFEDEDAENRTKMVEKRYQKWYTALGDMRPPHRYGPAEADITLVCWGSTYGAAYEAVNRLNAEDGARANMIHFTDLWPMSEEVVRPILAGAKRLVDVESNITGQFARHLRTQTGVHVQERILRYDGRPITSQYILDRLQ
jgi:2-oxoglutarate ferredoxin oxidoreductase subunit alpha